MSLFILFESAPGFALFEPIGIDEISTLNAKVQESLHDFKRLSQVLKLHSFVSFKDQQSALENQNDISEGILNDFLFEFLDTNVPKNSKQTPKLGVSEAGLQASINESALNISAVKDSTVLEISRVIRAHFVKFLKRISPEAEKPEFLGKSQLALGHLYSRARVMFNVNKSDNMIMQSISTLDQLDKDVNSFAMRVREWYSWHFPELVKIVNDNTMYARLVQAIGDRKSLTDDAETLRKINTITGDEALSNLVIAASKTSMGYEISEYDMRLVNKFATRVVSISQFKAGLSTYLKTRMRIVAPNLSALVGDIVGARLINHAGSLTSLAKYPASTVQVLGAEKALFRALKERGNTPKYGLIYNSGYITRAKVKDKGRISRFLANKCSIASRIDAFSDSQSDLYGQRMSEQVEERLKFFDSGVAPAKNIDIMRAVRIELDANPSLSTAPVVESVVAEEMNVEEDTEGKDTPKKSKSKSKSRRSSSSSKSSKRKSSGKGKK